MYLTDGDMSAACSDVKKYVFTRFCCVLSSAITDMLVTPLQERMDDWKKSVVALDREHTRGQSVEVLRSSPAVKVICRSSPVSYWWHISMAI